MKNTAPYYINVVGTPTEEDDEEVPGVYLVHVDASLDKGLHASAALDCFHGEIGIECLDDFDIAVIDQEGFHVVEDGDYDSSTLSLEGRAVFHGSIDPAELPPPPAEGPSA